MMAEKKAPQNWWRSSVCVRSCSDSDLSGLSDDEEQDITMKNIPARIRDEQEESNDGEKLAENSFIGESENEDENEDQDVKMKMKML